MSLENENTLVVVEKALIPEIRKIFPVFSDESLAAVAKLVESGRPPSTETLTPEMAAILFVDHNGNNRGYSIGKIDTYKDAMNRGEWRLNHQGMAFYADGIIADGQHRCGAIALSGVTVEVSIFRDFQKDSINTIDQGKARTAGDALQMKGITEAQWKASISKDAEEYIHKLEYGVKCKLSVQQQEALVIQHDALLSDCIEVGRSVTSIGPSPMTGKEAALFTYNLVRGGWSIADVTAHLTIVISGVAPYAQAPSLSLSKQFDRSKVSAQKSHHLNKDAKMALTCKSIFLQTQEQSVRELKYSKKESLPSNSPPDVEPEALAS